MSETEDQIRDEAAEVDAAPGADVGADETVDDEDLAALGYTGRCHGGPWDTSDVEVRYPKGFLLVHMPAKAVWIYDRRDDGEFYVRSDVAQPLADEGDLNRWRAANEPNYDIRVLEPDAVQPAAVAPAVGS